MKFMATIGIGLNKPARFILKAKDVNEAKAMLDDPPDPLRETIEQVMREHRVDPELRGWHNYEVLDVRAAWSKTAKELQTANISQPELEEALYVQWFEDDFDFLQQEYGTAKYDLAVAQLKAKVERLAERRGYEGLVGALRKRGHDIDSIKRLVRRSKK